MKHTVEQINRRFTLAKSTRGLFEGEWDEAYRFAFPNRESWYARSPGERRSRLIYDETAVEAVQEFASAMAFGLTPSFSQWFRLEPGALAAQQMTAAELTEVQGQLDEVTAYVFNAIDASDFQPANHEVFLDMALGWSSMWIDESDDPDRLLEFRTLPQNQLYIDLGPGNTPDGRFRAYRVHGHDLQTLYPGARGLVKTTEDDNNEAGTLIVDAIYRDWDERRVETWRRVVFQPGQLNEPVLWEREYVGYGASPIVTPRWSTTSFEAYGRGPLYNVLPAVRTANLVTQMTLENAEMAIAGLWQGDDDGIINFDSINLIPGTIVPRDPESRGLEPLESPGRFDVSNLILERMQTAIRRALYNTDLGPMDKTPMSATEAAERQSQVARRIGAPFARMMSEYVSPMIRRTVFLLRNANKIELPKVNGREIAVVSRSPLARAQRQENVLQFQHFDALLKNTFGEMAVTNYNEDEVRGYLAEKLEIPGRLLLSTQDRDALREQIAQAQQAQAQPQGAGGVPPA